jgi:SNF family Na+-dependent transporter
MMFYTTVTGWMVQYFVNMARGKFVGENICDNHQKVRVCAEFADNINGLIDAISMDAIDTDEYIKNTFNNE